MSSFIFHGMNPRLHPKGSDSFKNRPIIEVCTTHEARFARCMIVVETSYKIYDTMITTVF